MLQCLIVKTLLDCFLFPLIEDSLNSNYFIFSRVKFFLKLLSFLIFFCIFLLFYLNLWCLIIESRFKIILPLVLLLFYLYLLLFFINIKKYFLGRWPCTRFKKVNNLCIVFLSLSWFLFFFKFLQEYSYYFFLLKTLFFRYLLRFHFLYFLFLVISTCFFNFFRHQLFLSYILYSILSYIASYNLNEISQIFEALTRSCA